MKESINLRQQRFINFYLESGNATDALINAGYRCKHPDRAAHALIKKPYIVAEIEKVREKMSVAVQLTIEFKLKVLRDGINHYTNTGDYDKAAKLIEVSNKMQGHNAPDKSISNVTVTSELSVLKNLTEEYLIEYKTYQDHCH